MSELRGFYWNGRYYPPIAGGAPEGEGGEGDSGQTGQGSNDNGQGSASNQDDAGAAGDQTRDQGGDRGSRPETFSRDYVEQLRRENANWRKRAETAEGKVTEHERQQLSESERKDAEINDLKTRNAQLEADNKATRLRFAIVAEATKQGAVDPDAVYALLDRSALEVGDDGTVNGLDKAIKDLLEEKSYLKAQQQSREGVPATGRANGQTGMTDEERRTLQERETRSYASRF